MCSTPYVSWYDFHQYCLVSRLYFLYTIRYFEGTVTIRNDVKTGEFLAASYFGVLRSRDAMCVLLFVSPLLRCLSISLAACRTRLGFSLHLQWMLLVRHRSNMRSIVVLLAYQDASIPQIQLSRYTFVRAQEKKSCPTFGLALAPSRFNYESVYREIPQIREILFQTPIVFRQDVFSFSCLLVGKNEWAKGKWIFSSCLPFASLSVPNLRILLSPPFAATWSRRRRRRRSKSFDARRISRHLAWKFKWASSRSLFYLRFSKISETNVWNARNDLSFFKVKPKSCKTNFLSERRKQLMRMW